MKSPSALYDLLEASDTDLEGLSPEERADVLAIRSQDVALRLAAERFFTSTAAEHPHMRERVLGRMHRSRLVDQWLTYGSSVMTMLVLSIVSVTGPGEPVVAGAARPVQPRVESLPTVAADHRHAPVPPAGGLSPDGVAEPPAVTTTVETARPVPPASSTSSDQLDVEVRPSSQLARFDRLRMTAADHEQQGRMLHAIGSWRGLATIANAEGYPDVADTAIAEAIRCARRLHRDDLTATLETLRLSFRR